MRARILHALLILLPIVAIAPVAQAAQPLQPWLDMAPAGGVLRLAPGTYAGPAVISKPLTLEGDGKVVIDGGGRGTVLTIRADDVTLRGLHLRGSGGSHDALDGGIMAEGNRLRIENNVIDDVLFGISLHKSNDSVVRATRIRTLPGGKEVKIVMVSASVFKDQRDEVLTVGVDGFIRKPYRPEEIYTCMAEHLGVQYLYAGAVAAPVEITPSESDLDKLRELPLALRQTLEEASNRLEIYQIAAAIRTIAEIDASLGRTLRYFADNYNYTPILDALQIKDAEP